MHPPEEFLRHATDCKLTAKLARDPASKAAWNQMAERWLQCADLAERKSYATGEAIPETLPCLASSLSPSKIEPDSVGGPVMFGRPR
jgi:hypothetical protein